MNKESRKKQAPLAERNTFEIVRQGLGRRYGAERRFRTVGLLAVVTAVLFLVVLFTSIISQGYKAFVQTYVELAVFMDPAVCAPDGTGNFGGLIKQTLRQEFPELKTRAEKKRLYSLVSSGASFQLRDLVKAEPEVVGKTVTLRFAADDDVDMYFKNRSSSFESRLDEQQSAIIEKWRTEGKVGKRFNTTFFTAGDSREPEQSGILGALVGSMWTLGLTLLFSFPIGTATAVYLEEFAPRNKWVDFIEVNINNLAAVPSIIFGLLGLAVFINYFHMPRSTPLVGSFVLTLMTLPTIIIAARAALQTVPPSIRDAALAVGASKMQMVFHHVLPLAMPGIFTGTIIGMAQALGETAPLLMIGMVAFIVDVPGSPLDPSTVLPVQIYLWADSPERAFMERTSAAIMVLLVFLVFMNSAAVLLRSRFEKKK